MRKKKIERVRVPGATPSPNVSVQNPPSGDKRSPHMAKNPPTGRSKKTRASSTHSKNSPSLRRQSDGQKNKMRSHIPRKPTPAPNVSVQKPPSGHKRSPRRAKNPPRGRVKKTRASSAHSKKSPSLRRQSDGQKSKMRSHLPRKILRKKLRKSVKTQTPSLRRQSDGQKNKIRSHLPRKILRKKVRKSVKPSRALRPQKRPKPSSVKKIDTPPGRAKTHQVTTQVPFRPTMRTHFHAKKLVTRRHHPSAGKVRKQQVTRRGRVQVTNGQTSAKLPGKKTPSDRSSGTRRTVSRSTFSRKGRPRVFDGFKKIRSAHSKNSSFSFKVNGFRITVTASGTPKITCSHPGKTITIRPKSHPSVSEARRRCMHKFFEVEDSPRVARVRQTERTTSVSRIQQKQWAEKDPKGPNNYLGQPKTYTNVPMMYKTAPKTFRKLHKVYRNEPKEYRKNHPLWPKKRPKRFKKYPGQPKKYEKVPIMYTTAPKTYQKLPKVYPNGPEKYQNVPEVYQNELKKYQKMPKVSPISHVKYNNVPKMYLPGPKKNQMIPKKKAPVVSKPIKPRPGANIERRRRQRTRIRQRPYRPPLPPRRRRYHHHHHHGIFRTLGHFLFG